MNLFQNNGSSCNLSYISFFKKFTYISALLNHFVGYVNEVPNSDKDNSNTNNNFNSTARKSVPQRQKSTKFYS